MPPTVPSSGRSDPRRILVRGVNWLGDAVMTAPALQRLRERFPEAHITLVTPEKLSELWQRQPNVNEVIPFPAGAGPWGVAGRIKALGTGFDLALVFPNSPRAALEVFLACIPQRVGYARPWRNWFLTRSIPNRPGHVRMRKLSDTQVQQLVRKPAAITHPLAALNADAHQQNEYLHLVAAVGASSAPVAPRLEITPDETTAAAQRLASLTGKSLNSTVCLGLNPSAAYGAAKRWPAENFAAVARTISRSSPSATWLLFGTAVDAALCARIAELAGGSTVNLAGKTTLRELMATLKLCRVVLTNDSGPMHLAAALGTAVVALFGSTSPQLTGPGLPADPNHHVLQAGAACAPCFRRDCPIGLRCLTGITVDKTVASVSAVLGRWS